VLGLLNRRKWIVIVPTVAGSVGVFLVALLSILLPEGKSFWPNYYIPEAHVIISDSSAGGTADLLKSAGLSSLAGLAGIGSAGPTASDLAIRIASTDSFLDTIAADFDFYNRYGFADSDRPKTLARRMIKQNLVLTVDAGSGMMTVGYQAIDKVLATDVVNRVVDLLEEQFAVIAIDRNRTQLALVSDKLRDVETEMFGLQDRLNSLQQRYNTFDLAALAKELAARLGTLRAELLKKGFEIDSYGSSIGIEDPALRRLKVERNALRANVAKLERGYSENGVIVPAEAELPQLVLQYTRLKGDLDVQKKIYETLVQQQELIKLQVESVPRTFQIYEKAAVPERKSGPSRPKVCIVVAAASLVFGVALAFLVEYLARMLNDPANLRKLKGKSDET
jgi:capsule polysaccharide export protein KpsE/RkpR